MRVDPQQLAVWMILKVLRDHPHERLVGGRLVKDLPSDGDADVFEDAVGPQWLLRKLC